jgi:hypothetical protein
MSPRHTRSSAALLDALPLSLSLSVYHISVFVRSAGLNIFTSLGFSGWKLGENEKRLRKRCVSNTSSRELDNNYRFSSMPLLPRPILNSFFFASPIVAGISFKKKLLINRQMVNFSATREQKSF